MKKHTRDEEFVLHISSRLAAFMRDEREVAGRSICAVARKLRIKKSRLYKWEIGTTSPPAYILRALALHYGKASYFRLGILDFEFQLEKCRRNKARVSIKKETIAGHHS